MLEYAHSCYLVGVNPMKEFKSVAVDISTYNKLVKISTNEHRKIGQQIAKLVADHYKENYTNDVKAGIGSAA